MPSSRAEKIAKAFSDNNVIKKIPSQYLPRIAAVGYLSALISCGLLLAMSLVSGTGSSIVGYALTFISNILYIPIGYLSGLVASGDTYRNMHAVIRTIQDPNKKTRADRYKPSSKLFDALEISQAIGMSIMVGALVALAASIATDHPFWISFTQFFANSAVILASAMRIFESAWLSSCEEKIRSIHTEDLEASLSTITIENQTIKTENEKIKNEQQSTEAILTTLNPSISKENLLAQTAEKLLTSAQNKALHSPLINAWIDKGFSANEFNSLQDRQVLNIQSDIVSDLLKHNVLTLSQALNLRPQYREILEDQNFIQYVNQQKVRPDIILSFPLQDIEIENLHQPIIQKLLAENILSILDAIRLQYYHFQELQQQKNGYLLLHEEAIKSNVFLNLTPVEIATINDINSDRIVPVFKAIKLAEDFLSIPSKFLLYRLKAINNDATPFYLHEKTFRNKILQVQDEASLQAYITEASLHYSHKSYPKMR